MAAYVLTQAGANVLLLEAGGPWDNTRRLGDAQDAVRVAAPRRVDDRNVHSANSTAASAAGSSQGEPFTKAEGTDFDWWRARMLGGRTNHWGRISLRFGPDDFKAKSRDGLGDDWPIGYDDIKPYYDEVDRLIGIFGNNDRSAERAGRLSSCRRRSRAATSC